MRFSRNRGRCLQATVGFLFVVAMLAPLGCLLLYSFADRFSTTGAWPEAGSLRWYVSFARNPRAVDALLTSLIVAASSSVIALACGLPASWALARHRLRPRSAIEGVILLRAAIPVIVIGLGTAAVLYPLRLVDDFPTLVLAHAAGALPLVVWVVRPALDGLPVEMDDAARDLGAGLLWRAYVGLRAVIPAVIAAALFATLFSMDEFAVTFLIAGQRVVTLPVLLYGALESDSVQAAAAIAVVLLVPSLAIAIVAARLLEDVEGVLGAALRR